MQNPVKNATINDKRTAHENAGAADARWIGSCANMVRSTCECKGHDRWSVTCEERLPPLLCLWSQIDFLLLDAGFYLRPFHIRDQKSLVKSTRSWKVNFRKFRYLGRDCLQHIAGGSVGSCQIAPDIFIQSIRFCPMSQGFGAEFVKIVRMWKRGSRIVQTF